MRLTPNPPAVRTLLLDFASVDDGAATVSAIIAAGIVPAAIEMMDARITRAVEDFVHAGFPLDAAAVLIVEVDGLPAGVAAAVERVTEIGRAHGARSVRVAADDAERALIWKGRKSAFGAIARIKPNYYLHDTVVPRSRLCEVLRQVYEIADRHELIVMNVFHAGDGNLHPLLVFDKREPGVLERVHAAGDEIVRVSVAAGGVLSGEHGIGLEKRDLMPLLFTEPTSTSRPGCGTPSTPTAWPTRTRCCPPGAGAPTCRRSRPAHGSERHSPPPSGRPGRSPSTGHGTRGGPVAGAHRRAGAGWHRVDRPRRDDGELRRRHARRRARRRPRRAGSVRRPARRAAPSAGRWPSGTAASGASATARCATRCSRRASSPPTALVAKAGGPTVKNVSGFDLCRLLVGSPARWPSSAT